MPNERTSESYQDEIKQLKSLLEEEKMDRESAEREARYLSEEIDRYLKDKEFMRGQIEAFKFCVASGKGKKNAE